MSPSLTASIEPRAAGEDGLVTMHVTNASDGPLEVPSPDMGRPLERMNWPYSIETYRASLLMSYGYLTVTVADLEGAEVPQEPIETWSQPVLRPPVQLAPGESVAVPIPLARFFGLEPGRKYRVTADYGERDGGLRVQASGEVDFG